MNSRKILALWAAILLGGFGAAIVFGAPQYAKFITVADIERVTGLKGVNVIPKGPGSDDDLTFASQDGKVILAVTFLPASAFTSAKSSKDGMKSPLSGVGEEAFVGPTSGPLYILVFRKAAYTVILNTELEGITHARIPIEKLTEIAKIVAARL
jgi:hypothetical protein